MLTYELTYIKTAYFLSCVYWCKRCTTDNEKEVVIFNFESRFLDVFQIYIIFLFLFSSSSDANNRKSRRKSRAEKSDSVLRRRLADRHVDSDEQVHDTSVERHSREESLERVLKVNEQQVLKFNKNGDMPEACTLRRRVIEKDTGSQCA